MAAGDPDSAAARSSDALARAAELEAAAAEARAEAARARADELRRQIEAAEAAEAAAGPVVGDTAEEIETSEAAGTFTATSAAGPKAGVNRLLPALALGLAAVVAVGLLGLTGYLVWQQKAMARDRHSAALFAAAARQDIINLMSIDYNTAQDNVKAVLDSSTGRFRANFEETADDFMKALKDEKVITKATVNDTAVESMTGDTAVVLVSATSRREGPSAPKDQQEPRIWRIAVTLERIDDQIKMSAVEFV